MEKTVVELRITEWKGGKGKVVYWKEAKNIDDLLELQQKIYEVLKHTFINEFCIGCTAGLSFPDGKCRGCETLKYYGLTLEDIQK